MRPPTHATSDCLAALHATDLLCPDPVFVIGAPRSGTSVVAKALGRHPEFWTSNETKFLAYLFGGGQAEATYRAELERPTVSWIVTNRVSEDEFLAYVASGVNALLTSRSGKRRWVDHTPDYTAFAGCLARMFPGARFVQVVRDGRAVVHSSLHFAEMFDDERRASVEPTLPAYFQTVDAACSTWVTRVNEGHAFAAAEQHRDRCLTVRNEELVQDPVEGFERILDFLGAAPDPSPAAFFRSTRVNSSFKRRPGERLDAPWTAWPQEWVATFEEVCGATQENLGYEPVGAGRCSRLDQC